MPRQKRTAPPALPGQPTPQSGVTLGRRPAARDARGRVVPYQPTEQERITVCLAVSNGAGRQSIARLVNWPIGVSVETLEKHFAVELEQGGTWCDSQVLSSLMYLIKQKTDLKASLGAVRWYQANRNGWKSDAQQANVKADVEVPGGSGPMRFTLNIGAPVGAQGDDGSSA